MKTIQIVLLVLIVIGLGLIFTQKYWVNNLVNFILENSGEETANIASPLNATYVIDGKPVTLANGLSETAAAPGSASKTLVRYFGNEAMGDLNGDGTADIVFLLTKQDGGSGTFFYVVVAVKKGEAYQGSNAILLGDRIAPQTTEIRDGEIIVNYAERKPGEAMTAQPSVGVSKYLKIDQSGALIEVEKPVLGGDRDEHGCIGSAGYSWCEAKSKCLRTWEESCS